MITRRRLIGSTAAALALAAPALASGARLRLGYVTPRTGRLAAFAAADDYNLAAFRASEPGHEFEVFVRDSGSTPEGAAAATQALVEAARVHLVLAAGASETAGPVAAAAAAAGAPSLTTGATWEAWLLAQGLDRTDPETARPPARAFHFFWGIEDAVAVMLGMWAGIETNMLAAGLFPDDADGLAWGSPRFGLAEGIAGAGYKINDPGRPSGARDLASTIGAFRRSSADLLAGVAGPAGFAAFWTQARAQGFAPKIATIGKALLSPDDLDALGAAGHNLSAPVSWAPSRPYASALTGQSAAALAEDYAATSRRAWTQPLGVVHALLEVAADAMGRAAGPSDPDAVAAALAATRAQTVLGPVRWDGSEMPAFARANVARTPLSGGQWRRRPDGGFDLVTVASPLWPEIVREGTLAPLA